MCQNETRGHGNQMLISPKCYKDKSRGTRAFQEGQHLSPPVLLWCFCSSFSPLHLHLKISTGVSIQSGFQNIVSVGPCISPNRHGQPISQQKMFHMPQLLSCNLLIIKSYFLLSPQTSYSARLGSSPMHQHSLLGPVFASEAPSCTIQLRTQLPLPYLHQNRSQWAPESNCLIPKNSTATFPSCVTWGKALNFFEVSVSSCAKYV